MKKMLVFFGVFLAGCQVKYVEIKSLKELKSVDPLKIEQISVKSYDFDDRDNYKKWSDKYLSVFPIRDREKITKITRLLQNSEAFEAKTIRMFLCFEGKRIIYYMGFENYDDSFSYGDFWKSEELRSYLAELGLKAPKIDYGSLDTSGDVKNLPKVESGPIMTDEEVEKKGFLF